MSAALNSLLKKSSIEDHDEILELCNEALKQSKNDTHTQHVKVVALLQLNRFDDAVRVFDQGGEALKGQATLEYAYALYKSGDSKKARDVAQGLDSRGAKQLQAQVAYRLEDFTTAANTYEKLATQPQGEENDIRINLNASYAQSVWKRKGEAVKKTKADREDLEGYETAYNAACLLVARGELGQADILLRRSKDLCNASDDLDEDQKQEELLMIAVQQLYVLNALGKEEDAEKLAESISSDGIPDAATKRIATISKLAVTGSTNPYLAQRLLENSESLPVNDQFFGYQKLLADKNDFALSLACSKLEGIKRSTAKQISSGSDSLLDPRTNIASAANAAAQAQGQLGKQGLNAILPLMEKRPHDIGLLATVVQLYMLTGNTGAAIHVVEKFLKQLEASKNAAQQEARYSPGLVSIVVSLYSAQGRRSRVREELTQAASYWKSRQKPSASLLKAAGISLLEQGTFDDIKTAKEVFGIVSKAYPEDKIAKAGLAASSSPSSDAPQASETNFLTPIERLITGIDVAALEQAGIPRSSQSTAAILKRKRAEPSNTKPARKRVRKSQLPKDYDPNKKPDPERWLPLRDRSTYRPKGKKGKQKQSTATQGSNEKPTDGAPAVEKTTVATASTSNKAKKKKSKK